MKTLINTLRVLLPALLLAISVQASAQASAQVERGQKSFGPKAGYITRNTAPMAGLTFDYAFSRHFRIAPSIGLAFRNRNRDALLFDIDMHFPIPTWWTSNFYPLIGVAYNSWVSHDIEPETNDDVSAHENSLGFNAGAGWEIQLAESLRLGLESKWSVIRHNPNGQFTLRLAYVF